MASNQGTLKKGGNPKSQNQAGAPVFRAKAKPKVSPISGGNFDFSGDPRIGESFVVVVVGPDRARTITFHHPIGKTDLDDKDWVATPTSVVPDLVARKDDPNEATIREKRESSRLEAAIVAGYISRDDDDDILYPSGEVRQDILAEARTAAKDAAKKAGTKPAPMAYLAHLSAERRAEEDALRQFLQSDAVVRAAVRAFPDSTYRTMGGPMADIEQKAVSYLSGQTRAQAEDTVNKRVYG
nr:MAG: hypothetical protein [Plasmopara viticola lesion associated narnavirus 3]